MILTVALHAGAQAAHVLTVDLISRPSWRACYNNTDFNR